MVEANGPDGFELDWDDNGNMAAATLNSGLDFTYNWDNKLRRVKQDDSTIMSVKYDPDGNRIFKDSGETGRRKYIVDIVGNLPTILLEIEPGSGEIMKSYIHANGQPLCQNDGDYSAPRHFYIHDRLGSTRQIINTSGNVVRYYTYEPFGETIEHASDGSLATSDGFMFTGQYYDSEINQYYLRARQYDIHIYRFTSRDPISGQLTEPLTLHRYLYCINDPINKIDPSGEWALTLGGSVNVSTMMCNLPGYGLGKFGVGLVGNIIGYNAIILPYFTWLSEHVGFGGTGGGSFVVAHNEEQAWNEGWSFGGMTYLASGGSLATGKGGAVTIDIGYSPEAQRVTDLSEWYHEVGGSVGLPTPLFWGINTLSFAVSISVDSPGGGPTGITLYTGSFGWGTPGAEVHGYTGYVWAQEWFKN